MKTSPELQKAVAEYQKGSVEAFNTIYEQSYKYLHTCVIHVVKNEDMAMDMLQETYLEISKSISQLKSIEDFLSWAAMIANRKCFAHLKKQKDILLDGSGLGEGDSDSADSVTDYFENIADNEEFIPETVLQDREKQRLIKEIIDGLNDMQRLCVIGFYYNEQKQEEIAEELGIPVNTVKSHLNRAKAKIKEAVVELDVKKGTRLYSFAPFMALLFREEVQACVLRPMSKGLASAVGISAGVGSGALPGGLEAVKEFITENFGETLGEIFADTIGKAAIKVKALWAKFTAASIQTKAVVATTACAVTIGGAAVVMSPQDSDCTISKESQYLLDQMIELCQNSEADKICTLDFTELINNADEEDNYSYGMHLRFQRRNGENIPRGYFYDGKKCELVCGYSGYGVQLGPYMIAVGEFENGIPNGTLYVMDIDYTTAAHCVHTENEYFIATDILQLAMGEKEGKEKSVFSQYVAVSDIYEEYPESFEAVRYEGVVSKIERMIGDSLYMEYQFTGEILETHWRSDFVRLTNRIILDENGKLDFNLNKVEFSSSDGREYVQFYDADGKELYGITTKSVYEGYLEHPYVSSMSQLYGYYASEGKNYPD